MFLLASLFSLLAQATPFDLPVGSNYLFATLIVGFCISPFISFLSGTSWSAATKGVFSFLFCVFAAVLLLVAGNQLNLATLNFQTLFATFLVVFVMAITLYRFYFAPSGLAQKLEAAGPVK